MDNDDEDENKYKTEEYDENLEYDDNDLNKSKSNGKKGNIVLIFVVFIIAVCGGIYFGLNSDSDMFEKIENFTLKGSNTSKSQALSSSSSESQQSSAQQRSVDMQDEASSDEIISGENSENNDSVQLMTFESASRLEKFNSVFCEIVKSVSAFYKF